jgi:uncharacterized membrane protein (DUF2068 family)
MTPRESSPAVEVHDGAGPHVGLRELAPESRRRRELGMRSIIAYKTAKAALQLVLALVLLALLPLGLPDWLAVWTVQLRHRFVQGFSVRLVNWLAWDTTPHRIDLTIGALGVDGVVTAVEAWALRRDFAWAPWLVAAVVATLLPFEAVDFYRHPHLARVALLAANVAVVVYLVRRARAHRRAVAM